MSKLAPNSVTCLNLRARKPSNPSIEMSIVRIVAIWKLSKLSEKVNTTIVPTNLIKVAQLAYPPNGRSPFNINHSEAIKYKNEGTAEKINNILQWVNQNIIPAPSMAKQ